ncbi:MAG: TrbC/VirB2 family protein, partial [bacterium]|nr:TrbC/VirB2 family protein [bacterium]
SVGGLVQDFIEIITYLAILLAVLLLVWTGFQFILARGDSKKMSELKDKLVWIVVGVAVVISARLIIQVVINTLRSTGTVDEKVIQGVDRAIKGK